jgi:GntR family transcriptional regulator
MTNLIRNNPDTKGIVLGEDIIDLDSAIPYYYQLYQYLKHKIQSGEWEAGQKLPSESELCNWLSVSRPVVRQALGELVSDGLISTYKGKGSFITGIKYDREMMQSLSGFYEDAIKSGQDVFARVLDLRIIPAADEVAEYLRVPDGENIIFMRRLRIVDGEPIMLGITHIPERLCPGLLQEDFRRQSLYRTLATKYRIHIFEGVRTMESVNASESIAKLLEVPPGAALSLIKGTMYLQDGTPLEYAVSWHRGDRSRFQVRLVNSSV